MALEIGYAGSKGTHLSRLKDINLPRRTEAAYLAGIAGGESAPVSRTSTAPSTNSSSAPIRSTTPARSRCGKRGRGGTFYRLNYGYSKSIDDASQLNGTSDGGLLAAAQDINNFRARPRPLGLGSRPRGHGLVLLAAPVGRGAASSSARRSGCSRASIGGWQFSGTAFFATGAPIHAGGGGYQPEPGRIAEAEPDRPAASRTRFPGQRRGVDYPWFVPTLSSKCRRASRWPKGCPADQYGFQPFVYGNAGRNILDGPGIGLHQPVDDEEFPVPGEQEDIPVPLRIVQRPEPSELPVPNNQFNSTQAGLITEWRSRDAADRECSRRV